MINCSCIFCYILSLLSSLLPSFSTLLYPFSLYLSFSLLYSLLIKFHLYLNSIYIFNKHWHRPIRAWHSRRKKTDVALLCETNLWCMYYICGHISSGSSAPKIDDCWEKRSWQRATRMEVKIINNPFFKQKPYKNENILLSSLAASFEIKLQRKIWGEQLLFRELQRTNKLKTKQKSFSRKKWHQWKWNFSPY